MDYKYWLLHVTVFAYYFSLGGYVIGLILSNEVVRNAITKAWCFVSGHAEKITKLMLFRVIDFVISAVYEDHGKLSQKKLITIVIIMNSMFLLGIYMSGEVFEVGDTPDANEFYAMLLFFPVASYISEYISYKITRYMFNRALKNLSIFFILFDVMLLIFVFLFYYTIVVLYVLLPYSSRKSRR